MKSFLHLITKLMYFYFGLYKEVLPCFSIHFGGCTDIFHKSLQLRTKFLHRLLPSVTLFS